LERLGGDKEKRREKWVKSITYPLMYITDGKKNLG